jgi:NAD-dependent SIR2 family protein deacetylase
MSYCGICNKHNVTFTQVEGGYHCSGCDEIIYDDEMERHIVKETLIAAKLGKKEGWKLYPNIELFGEPIDKVIEEYSAKCIMLGIKI